MIVCARVCVCTYVCVCGVYVRATNVRVYVVGVRACWRASCGNESKGCLWYICPFFHPLIVSCCCCCFFCHSRRRRRRGGEFEDLACSKAFSWMARSSADRERGTGGGVCDTVSRKVDGGERGGAVSGGVSGSSFNGSTRSIASAVVSILAVSTLDVEATAGMGSDGVGCG
jgi:hypothetical protein